MACEESSDGQRDGLPAERSPSRSSGTAPSWATRAHIASCTTHLAGIYVYDPADGKASPPYRFYPNATLPDRLVTNQIGWRGRPIEVPRGPKTVRIVFVGSSTVVDGHFVPFSYPEFVGHWLNLWAAAHHPGIHFEVLNSARESNVSTDIANIVRTEVLPLHPDLVVYYEGGNQFQLASIVDKVPAGPSVRPLGNGASLAPPWLSTASRFSALLGRVQIAIGYAASDMDGREWPKPDHRIAWPQGLDEQDPDLVYANLPVFLTVIEHQTSTRIQAAISSTSRQRLCAEFPCLDGEATAS